MTSESVVRLEDAMKANQDHKMSLNSYITELEKELASVDALIAGAASNMNVPDDMDSDEELPYTISVPEAILAMPPISIEQLEDLSSPFYKASQRHIRYNDLTSDRTWTDAETSALKDAVQREGMRQHALQLQAQGVNAILALKDIDLSSYNEVKEGLDWNRIASYVPERLPSMCKVRWLAHEHPGVVRGAWTEQERLDLKRAVEEAKRQPKVAADVEMQLHNEPRPGDDTPMEDGEEAEDDEEKLDVDWDVVAGFLGSGRVAADCMKAYRSTSGRSVPTIWTPELDNKLLEAVKQHGANNMTTVAMSMPIVLSRQQCTTRYNILTSTKNSGKWSFDEDDMLEKLVDEIPEGTNKRWKVISARMGTRTDRQCRQRWTGVLDKNVKRGDWTEEEDSVLRAAVEVSDKPDAREIGQDLNRPTLMVRRRLAAFAKGETPSKYVKRKAVRIPSTPASVQQDADLELQPMDTDETGRPAASATSDNQVAPVTAGTAI